MKRQLAKSSADLKEIIVKIYERIANCYFFATKARSTRDERESLTSWIQPKPDQMLPFNNRARNNVPYLFVTSLYLCSDLCSIDRTQIAIVQEIISI